MHRAQEPTEGLLLIKHLQAVPGFVGTLFQMLVIVPMWSASPPESVREFFTETDYNRTILNFFGPPFMLARTLPLIAALIFAWSRPRHRLHLGIASVCVVAAVVFTVIHVYPINAVLFFRAGGDLPADEVTRLVHSWILADRVRFVVGVVAFVAILKAFRLPLRETS